MLDKKRLVVNCEICDTRKLKEKVYSDYEQIVVNADTIIVNEESKAVFNRLPIIMNNKEVIALSDTCVILDSTFVMDKYFPIKAREGKEYFVSEEVVIAEKNIDIQKLLQKNVQIKTKKLGLPECKVEDCAMVFDEGTEFIVVPDEMSIISENSRINKELIAKHGKQLFVYGNAEFDEEDMCVCDEIEKLVVKGTVILKENQLAAFQSIDAEYDKLEIIKGAQIRNQVFVKIDNDMLETLGENLQVQNVAKVELANDIELETILKYLEFRNCACIICNDEQSGVVAAVSENVASIGSENIENIVSVSMMQGANVINSDYFEM